MNLGFKTAVTLLTILMFLGFSSFKSTSKPFSDPWPALKTPYEKDEEEDSFVLQMLQNMTIEEKVGQITQADIRYITPKEVGQYHIGSILSGGGAWPSQHKHAAVEEWLNLADAYYEASIHSSKNQIPVIWGIDAVHGHNNVFGATVFPHNIGLGAANDPRLLYQIGIATAQQVRTTGQDWIFAPTVAVAQNPRWGRTYESYNQNPRIVASYAEALIKGIQNAEGNQLNGLIATAKHFIGDGGTRNGQDQGITDVSLEKLIETHAPGYFSAILAGVQSIMISYSSLAQQGGKMHGNKHLITDILKDRLGFDGIVVSDWNGIEQVPECTASKCPQAILAGIDVFMVPIAWKDFIANTLQLVKSGEVPIERIDDAVTRILRVKYRAGLFNMVRPSSREGAGETHLLRHTKLAEEAVHKSLVLVKNKDSIVPLKQNNRILVVGKNANNIPNQIGGWGLTWQGNNTDREDYPHATSVLDGIQATLGKDSVAFSETGDNIDISQFDVVIAVIGETPYAEYFGDIKPEQRFSYETLHPEDMKVLRRVATHHVPIVTVYIGGRPIPMQEIFELSTAFIAAWLPGTQGGAIADLLIRKADASIHVPFSGKLPFEWPNPSAPKQPDGE